MHRSLPAAALAFAISACQPSLPHTPPPDAVVTAVFDPLSGKVPLPNDLALPPFNMNLNSVCPPGSTSPAGTSSNCAQAELLNSFGGKFPNDQEVAITIDFAQTNLDSGKTTQVAPDLDLATFTPSTFFVYNSSPPYAGEVPIAPLQASDYVKFDDHGTLTIHYQGHAPWPPGSYAVLLRGGPNGVKTTNHDVPVYASQVFDLLAQGQDMTDPKNLGLLKAQLGSTAKALDQGRQLNILIAVYKGMAYPVADTRFPHQELAVVTTFQIGAETNVAIDPARGLAPLPIDLLRDPRDPKTNPAGGKLTPLAACTLVGSSLAADGTCPSPAAAGFLALDGFSTTGAILAPTSELIRAATVTKDSLQLYDLSNPAQPVLVDPGTLILEPCELTSACNSATALSPVVAIQPAGATSGDPTSVLRTRPLKDNTDYAVVLTTDILDKAGNPLGRSTVAKVLQFVNPVVDTGGHSALLGIDDATAAGLEKMRKQLVPVFDTLTAAGVSRFKVAIAYTFHTQTILSQANHLAALPYSTPAATALPGPVTPATLAKFGAAALPNSHIDEILETDITTFNALDATTGAFLADPTKAVPETIHVLIATPKADNPKVPACKGGLQALGKCAPLMVFRHGLGRGRIDMLAIADSYAEAGMVTVAIDAAKHGDRSFCTSGTTGATSGCTGGGACTTSLPAGAQGDKSPPGTCAAGFVKKRLDGTLVTDPTTQDGIPVVSGNYLVSANFFRTRDTLRQDLIDESQLIRALAFAPAGAPSQNHTVFDHIFTHAMATFSTGMLIDPTTIFFSGQSLGAIQGTMDVATNPRISKAAFNVGGGTIVDIFNSSPAFADVTNQLLAGLGIAPGSPQFLQFLVVAKTVLDPADPINFAGHLTGNTLPNLLTGGTMNQAPKAILTQIAHCDGVVPNPLNLVHASNIGTSPLPTSDAFFTDGGIGTFQVFASAGFTKSLAGFQSCTTGVVEHGFLLDFTNPALTAAAQSDIASFVMSPTNAPPPSLEIL
jgi:hypothetical protein